MLPGVEQMGWERWAGGGPLGKSHPMVPFRTHHLHQDCPKIKTHRLQRFKTGRELAIKRFPLVFTTLHGGFHYLCFTGRKSLAPKSQGHLARNWQGQNSN